MCMCMCVYTLCLMAVQDLTLMWYAVSSTSQHMPHGQLYDMAHFDMPHS
jgi:hypothetical protein